MFHMGRSQKVFIIVDDGWVHLGPIAGSHFKARDHAVQLVRGELVKLDVGGCKTLKYGEYFPDNVSS